MKKNLQSRENNLRRVLTYLILIGSVVACNGTQVSSSGFAPAVPSPQFTQTVPFNETIQANTGEFAPPARNLPTDRLVVPSLEVTDREPLSTDSPRQDVIREFIGKINSERVVNDLQMLTGEKPICTDSCYTIINRKTGSEGLKWAKDYIYSEFSSSGYSVEYHNWLTIKGYDQNIIARKPGVIHPEEEIYFVAHLDGVGADTVNRYPAADDNASGVVAILEMARVLSDGLFDRTLVFLISTGEEQGALGVNSYLGQLSSSEINAIKYVINIDMIGYDANQDAVMELWHGGHAPSIVLVNQISDIIAKYQINLVPKSIVGCG